MNIIKKWRVFRVLFTWLFLFFAWFFFCFRFDLLSVTAGIAGALVMALISYDVFVEEYEAGRRSILPRIIPGIRYVFYLVFRMYRSSFRILPALFSGGLNPRVVHFRSHLRSDLARVVLAHSISFTPGTFTLEMDDDHLIVHWLFAETRHSVKAGEAIKGKLEEGIRRIWL